MFINEVEIQEKIRNMGPRERRICLLLLEGCDNREISKELDMALRTVKAHFNRMFLRFNISGGIKRVKLATFLYRRKECLQILVDQDRLNQKSIELSGL